MRNSEPHEGMRTPWGTADSVEKIIDGMAFVGTPSHGGVKLSRERNAQIPEYMRRANGWYEEDCDYCIPYIVFEKEIAEKGESGYKILIAKNQHWDTFKNWHYLEYERFTNSILAEGESYEKDEHLFKTRNVKNWVTICARGDWAENCPKGYVEVTATIGGNRECGVEQRIFYVPAADYDNKGKFAYVVDENNPAIIFRWVVPGNEEIATKELTAAAFCGTMPSMNQ